MKEIKSYKTLKATEGRKHVEKNRNKEQEQGIENGNKQ